MSFTVPAWLDCTHFEELKSLKKAKIWPILRFTLSPGWDKNKQTNSWCCGGRIHLLYAANNQHIKLELKKDVPNFKTFWGCRVSFMRSQKLLSFISQICCISLSYPLLMTIKSLWVADKYVHSVKCFFIDFKRSHKRACIDTQLKFILHPA